jgi:RimJ/RimL family protein N-acetyltransferase
VLVAIHHSIGHNPGMAFDLQPILKGELVEIRPLKQDDWNELFAVASDPLIWEQHPAYDRYQEDVFRGFFQEAMESHGAFAVLDKSTQQIIGSTRYFGFDTDKSEIEIGWTFLARRYWGKGYNHELKKLMLDHAFKHVATVVFFVGEHNIRSQKAMEKIGGIRIGLAQKDYQTRVVTSVIYAIKKPG